LRYTLVGLSKEKKEKEVVGLGVVRRGTRKPREGKGKANRARDWDTRVEDHQ